MNRITSVTAGSTVNYTYDAAGNVTNDGAHSYTYDSENRLVSVDGGVTAQYSYDQQNRRYKKTIGSTVTHYTWAGGKVLGEYNGSTGTLQVNYWYAGERLFKKTGVTTQVFLSDRVSIRLALSEIGVVAGRQGHAPFGEDFAESGTQEKHHFTRYERDGESGQDYAVNREYSASVGRFMRPDPYRASAIADAPQSMNRYAYVRNDPVNLNDPMGLVGDPFLGPVSVPGEWCRFWPAVCGDFGPQMPWPRQDPDRELPTKASFTIPDVFSGYLTVDPNCGNSVLYVSEDIDYDTKDLKHHPERQWKDAANLNHVATDFVATARGVVKIGGGCNCRVICTGGADYRIECDCTYTLFGVGFSVSIMGEQNYETGQVSNPRNRQDGLWWWVDSRNHYSAPHRENGTWVID